MKSGYQYLSLPKGEVLFRENDHGDCAYVIESGALEISVRRPEKSITIATLGPGEVIGEMAMISTGQRSATATALEDCSLKKIDVAQFARRVEAMDPVMRMAVEVILARFRKTLKSIQVAPNSQATLMHKSVPASTGALQQLRLEMEMATAIRKKQLVVHYQPIVDLANGKLAGLEAQIRWDHPERGLLLPNAFIQTAEQSNLQDQVTVAGLRRVVSALPGLRTACLKNVEHVQPIFVGLNVTGRDLASPVFAGELEQVCNKPGFPVEALELEITERALAHGSHATDELLAQLQKQGMTSALDNFGADYSNIANLSRWPVSKIIMDPILMSSFDETLANRETINVILRLAAELDRTVTAKAVGSQEQCDYLAGCGCTFGQGRYFGEPKSFEETRSLIETWNADEWKSAEPEEVATLERSTA